MPRVHTQKARSDIYYNGFRKKDKSTKSGFRIDRSKPADKNDAIAIKKGITYYKWTFRYGGTHRSTKYPKPSQLTQSAFLQTVYGFAEQRDSAEITTVEEISELAESLIQEAEELRDEQEEKRDNMPEQLQDAPTGELLQERYDALEEFINELEEFTDLETDKEDEEIRNLEFNDKLEEFQNINCDTY